MTTAEVVDALASVLAPYLGETMARASARTHCDKLGVKGQMISVPEAQALVGKLASGLNVFVGREKTAGVRGEMERVVDGLGVSR